MSRLYQKSLIASGGIHVLLGLILFVGPAFMASKPKTSDIQPIRFFPSMLIDAPFDNPGGSSGSRAPTPAPAPLPPAVQPAPAPPPQPTRRPALEEASPKTSDSLEVAKETGKKKPQVDVTHRVRNPNLKAAPKDSSTDDSQERALLAQRQKWANQIGRAIGSLKSGTGSATRIDEDFAGGDGTGPSYASYASWVWSYFDRAWVRPEDASMEDATVEASVTIAREGTVVAKRIVKRSGDAAVDASVQRVLDRVATVGRPFPEGAKDKERTYIIPFNMKSKRGGA